MPSPRAMCGRSSSFEERVDDSEPLLDHLTVLQVFRVEDFAAGPQRRRDDDRVIERELVALHHKAGAIVVIDGERRGVADAAHRIENLTNIIKRHGELADRDSRKLVQNLDTEDAGCGEQRLNSVCFFSFR